jgi:predicted RNA-binding protein with PIN domain
MAITYVIDGYNLMHAMGLLLGNVKPLGLARARLQLQEFLAGAFGDEAAQVTVVFDAARAPPNVPRTQIYKGLTLLLAVGQQEADDLIETLIAHDSTPKRLMIVSSDHRLQTAARRRGAQAMGSTEFLDFLDDRRQQKPAPPEAEPEKKENLSKNEINIWLQEFAGLEDEPDLKEAFERFDFEI